MGDDTRAVVEQRFSRACRALEEARTRTSGASPDDREAVPLAYFEQAVACPFLEDESCSIHRHRPSVCREYLVTSPAEHCDLRTKKPIARIPVAVRLREALARLTANLLDGSFEVIPLPMALEWATAHHEEGQRTWDGEALVEGLVRELGAS
jgi:hypothetical protein